MERSVGGMSGRDRREDMLPPLKRHEIQVLRRAGHSQAEVARLAEVSVRTVRRVDEEESVAEVDARKQVEHRGVGRPSKTAPFRDFVVGVLDKEPELMSLEVLRRARLRGYGGSKSAMYQLITEVRPKQTKPVVRFEGLPGEFSQHDFGEVDVRFVDGRRKRIVFFASRLKYSRWVQVTIVPDQQVESLVRTLVEHFEAIGGVPLVAVFDRPKTVVLSSKKDGTVTEWNSTFAQVMLELGVGVEVCWPRSGNQKGSVERLVGWVKSSFFKQRRFIDEDDLRRQLIEWLDDANHRTPSRATKVTPEERMKEEQPRLRPVKLSSSTLALRFPVVIGPTAMVSFEGSTYSMPPESIGMSATVYLRRDELGIVAGRYEAVHLRQKAPGGTSVLPHHRAEMVASVSGKRAKRYYKREQILALGETAHAYLTEVVHRRPERWMADVERLFELLQHHGEPALREAIGRALEQAVFGAEYVARLLGEHEVHQLSLLSGGASEKGGRR